MTVMTPDLRYRTGSSVTIGDRSIYCEHVRVTGAPTLVFVNNFYIVAPMWRNYINRISETCSYLIYDLENQGGSSMSSGATIESHTETLVRLLEVCGIEHPVLVGTSTSALICLQLARQMDIDGLILAGPSVTPSNSLVRQATERSLVTSLRLGGTEALWDHLYALSMSNETMRELGPTGYLGLRAAFTAVHRRDPMLDNMRAGLAHQQDFSRLTELDAPVGLILGEHDTLWPESQIDEAREICRPAELFVRRLSGAGHLPYMEDPEGFQIAVVDFLRWMEAR